MLNKIHLSNYSPVTIYILSTAASMVLIHDAEKNTPTFLLTFIAFFLCIFLFHLINIKRIIPTYSFFYKDKKAFLTINALTLIIWLGTFYGLKLIQPSLFISVFMGSLPLFSIFIKKQALKKNSLYTLASITLILFLLSGYYVVKHPPYLEVFIGLFCTVLSAFVSSVYICYTDKLQRQNQVPWIDVVCTRFYFITIFSFIICYFSPPQINLYQIAMEKWYNFLFISLLSTILPVYSAQKAISNLGAVKVSLLMALIPLCVYFMQGVYIGINSILEFIFIIILSILLIRLYYLLYAKN